MASVSHAALDAVQLAILTLPELKGLIAGQLVVPRTHQSPKAKMLEWVVANVEGELRQSLYEACCAKTIESVERRQAQKRKAAASLWERRQSRRMDQSEVEDKHNIDKYLTLPSDEDILDCYRDYFLATSNEAMKLSTCAVCAREVGKQLDHVSVLGLDAIPNRERLIPTTPHPEHDLYDGLLLEPAGVISVDNSPHSIQICDSCLTQLNTPGRLPPPQSLANNLWVGRIPFALAKLTVPEQMLIALLYPRIFVFKLFPKDKSFRPQDCTLQRGMRGNVSTYEQDLPGVAAMVEGHLMPRPVEILSCILTITYVGKQKLAMQALHSTFRVRRGAVHDALLCLKQINPKYYGKVVIDEERLRSLPEDDVPSEIADVVRHSSDIGIIDQESAGYVPVDEDEAETLGEFCHDLHSCNL